MRHTTRRGQDKLADIQNILHETITGNRIVKAFSMESWEIARFRQSGAAAVPANLRSVAAAAISSPLMDIFGAIAIALLLLLGRDQIDAPACLPLGTFGAFIVAVFKLYDPVRKFALFNNNFQQALGASSEIFKFMDTEDDVQEKPGAKPIPPFSQSIRLEDVCFSYETDGDESREILRDINLEVRAGEVVAVVGSSGAGKSTLVHLIPRFFDVTAGRLLIDGRDVRDITLASLRSQIGVVTQETVLFNDTLRNNIAYGQPSISQKQVEAAARAALAHDFIMELPERLRHHDRRARGAALGRRTAAHRHCARLAEECADPDSGRSHVRAGQRVGGAGAVGAAESDDRADRVRDRAPAFDRPPRRPDCGARKRDASPTSGRTKSSCRKLGPTGGCMIFNSRKGSSRKRMRFGS